MPLTKNPMSQNDIRILANESVRRFVPDLNTDVEWSIDIQRSRCFLRAYIPANIQIDRARTRTTNLSREGGDGRFYVPTPLKN